MTLELEPSDPRTRLFLGQAYVLNARFDEGIAEIQQALKQSHNNSLILSGLGWAYAMAGRREEALKVVTRLKKRFDEEHPRPYLIAKVYTGLKEKDLAFEWLEEAFCQHDTSLAFVKTDESLAYLRDDPRFVDLLRRMKLEP
jgi:tetratricopeptide (TPR) repeat protein